MWEIGVLAVVVVAILLAKPKKLKNLMITRKDQSSNETIYQSIWSLNGLRSGPHQILNSLESTNEPKTMLELLNYAYQKYKDANMFGFRSLSNTVKEVRDGKSFTFYQLSGYKWMTMSLFYHRALALGKYLGHLLAEKQVLCIFASTSIEWQLVAHAAWSQNIVICTAYDTLGADGLEYSLTETVASLIYCTSDQFTVLIEVLTHLESTKKQNVRTIIYKQGINTTSAETTTFVEQLEKFANCIPIEEAIIHGDPLQIPLRAPLPTDTACIMYTSGSTGTPKGVEITHSNIMATIGSAQDMLGGYIGAGDVYLAYLPLAHILELAVETCCLYLGIQLGFGTTRTLTDQFTKNCNGDIKELRPTVMVGVPQVWDTIRKGILKKIESASLPIRMIFWGAYKMKQWSIDRGLPMAHVADFAFKKIRAATGGKLKIALSGGSPLNSDTQTFLTNVLCPIYVGFGMTETVGMGCLLVPQIGFKSGVVGVVVPSLQLKLVNYIDYCSTDNPPRGEIWLKGPSICKGYYKQPKITRESFEDGWLKTGDIGEIVPLKDTALQRHNEVPGSTGLIKIIDRKKNLVKLSNGEYIALEALESVYKQNKHCVNVMVTAHSECKLPIIVVNSLNCQLTRIQMLESLLTTAKEYKLKGTQLVGNVVISEEEWTPANGMLTAAMKLQRREICKRYQKEINEANDLLRK
eukprot:NODE_298_length_11435_cov_0.210303.p1 type:complete len:693 gc:universal NODE_298_length_11435_cov_0.210303:9521-7443(-)